MSNIDERTGKPKIILHLCADMGTDSIVYKEQGYDVRCIGQKIGVENYNPPDNVYGIIANPPCTMFSLARSKAKIPRDLKQGMFLVKECLRIIWECQYKITEHQRHSPLKFWALENPGTGFLKWFLGKPYFEYKQSEYGECMHKKTYLWGMFNKPEKPLLCNPIPSNMCRSTNPVWGSGVNGGDGGSRAKCIYSFAKAFFEANQ